MKLIKKSFNICVISFRQWIGDGRILMVFLAVFTLCYIVLKPLKSFLEVVGERINAAVPVFLFDYWFNRLFLMIFFIILMCDAPFINETQKMAVLRSGRISWGIGKFIYILATGIIYIFSVYLFSWIILFPYVEFSGNWGKAVMTLSKTDASAKFLIGNIFFKGKIVDYFSPYQAVCFSFLLCFLAIVFLGLVIFIGNFANMSLRLGLLLAMVFILFDVGISMSGVLASSLITYFSPVTWSSLTIINIGGIGRTPDIEYIITMYSILVTVLFICLIIFSRRKQMD